jgi:hypothetical protein
VWFGVAQLKAGVYCLILFQALQNPENRRPEKASMDVDGFNLPEAAFL